jgi:hypothetical protein
MNKIDRGLKQIIRRKMLTKIVPNKKKLVSPHRPDKELE